MWLWLQATPEKLAPSTLAKLEDPGVALVLSVASAWEIAIKHALGKLALPCPPMPYVSTRLARHGLRTLPVELHHALGVADLPPLHSDPFDRILVSQARAEGMTLVTADPNVLRYGGLMLPA